MQLSIETSSEIVGIASEDIVRTAKDEAHDLSRVVVNKIDSVTTNLQVLSNAPSIQSEDAIRTAQFFDAAQYSTQDVTDYYMWLDSDGTIRAASNVARASYQYSMLWNSEKPPFLTEPQKTGTTYYSGVIMSPAENTGKVFIAYPIVYNLQQDQGHLGEFRGVIVASIRLDTLGSLLTDELSPTIESDVSLADRSGTVIYSVDKSAIGKSIFDNPAHITKPLVSELDDSEKAEVAALLEDSISRSHSGVTTIHVSSKSYTVAYNPIIHDGSHFWTLYIIAPHTFTDNVATLLTRQDTFTMLSLAIIGIVAVGVAYMILSSNRRLGTIVKMRTQDLENANLSLSESNKKLAGANELLKTHDKMQREFINIAAHELRTPIMPILAMSDVIESRFRKAERSEILLAESDFALISRNARRLERLAADILDVTRIETQSLHLNKQFFDLYELAEHIVGDIGNQFPNPRLGYTIKMQRPTTIFADKSRIGQVLSNLLANAAKFTDEGEISVSTSEIKTETGQYAIRVSVSDTGVGINNDVLPRLFTKFANSSGSDRAQIGSGLGLYISKGVVQAHGGDIGGENNQGGKGATFFFTVPLMPEQLRKL